MTAIQDSQGPTEWRRIPNAEAAIC
jgi:hypothetical protein